jgi:sorbitol-specific phosphotransferase system component IIBC
VQQAKSACKRKGLFQDYNDAITAESKAEEQVKNLRKAIANAIGPVIAIIYNPGLYIIASGK